MRRPLDRTTTQSADWGSSIHAGATAPNACEPVGLTEIGSRAVAVRCREKFD